MVLGLFRVVPPAWGRKLGGCLGRAALVLRPRERERGLANMRAALPRLGERSRGRLLSGSAVLLGRNFFDMFAADRLAGDDERFGYAPGEEEEFGPLGVQMSGLMAGGRGLILLTGHLGSWELLGVRVARVLDRIGRGPLLVITGTVHNEPVDRLLQDRRRAAGLLPVPRRAGSRPLVAHLKRGGAAALLLDQKLSDTDPAVTFFGRPAPTPDGVVRMAVRLGIPLLPVAMAWERRTGRHVIHRLPVLNPTDVGADADDDRAGLDERVRALLQDCQAALEKLIRRNPRQWVWFHDRWLTGFEERK